MSVQSADVYADLQGNHVHLLEQHGETDSGRWEIDRTAELDAEELTDRLAVRQRQHKAVIELVTAKVKENYTRFVQGINKIQEVGDCSDETLRICDEGKTRLKMTKDGLIVRSLKIAQRQRRKVNMQRAHELLEQLRTVHSTQLEVQKLLSNGKYAEAAIAITEGQKKVEETDGLLRLKAVAEIMRNWTDQRSTLYHTHIDKSFNECCKRFSVTRFDAAVNSVLALGYEKESSSSLVNKWKHVVGLIALASIRPFAIKNKGSDEVLKADVRELMRMLQADDVVRAMQELTKNLAHSMWTFKSMLRFLASDAKYKLWHAELVDFKPGFWNTIQDKVTGFLTSCKFHTLTLQSFMKLITTYKMFTAYGGRFHGPVNAALDELLHTLTRNYLSEVFHKEALEITRMGMMHDTCTMLSVDECKVEACESMCKVVPTQEEVGELCRLAADFDDAEDSNANPFVLAGEGGSGVMQMDDHSGYITQPLTSIALKMLLCVQQYKELVGVFPKASPDVRTQLSQLLSFYLYIAYSNYCDVPEGAGGPYHPERDPRLPSAVVKHLEEMKQVSQRHVPKELNIETGEPKPFEPPVVQKSALRAKLASASDLFGYRERYYVVESAQHVLRLLRGMWEGLGVPGAAADADRLVATTKVMAASMTKRLAMRIFPLESYPKLISECKWEPKTLESDSNVYVYSLLRDMRSLTDRTVHDSNLPESTMHALWTAIVEHLWWNVVKGYSLVKKCNTEGRALMSLDVQSLQHSLKSVVQGSVPPPDLVEDYVKAFYLEPEDYLAWVKTVHERYTAKQLLSLANINSNKLERMRRDNKEFNKRIEDELQALDHRDPTPYDV